jgi:predicted transposase/invertase (TIGR01784 family)
MPELTNPHDHLFKELLARPEAAADFLANYLPPEIAGALDLTALEPVRDSFVDAELREHLSDLLYRVRLQQGGEAFVYILFEHQSTPDEWVAFQLLRYLVRIWEQVLRQGASKLPPIFPLVFSHGRTRWQVNRRFSALVNFGQHRELRKYVPEFRYHLCDLSRYDAGWAR